MAGSNPNRVTMSGALPSGALNGIEVYHDELLKQPAKARLLVAIVDVLGDGANYDRGERWPILRFRHAELVEIADDQQVVMEAFTRAMVTRTHGELEQPLFTVGEVLEPPEKPSGRKPKELPAGGPDGQAG